VLRVLNVRTAVPMHGSLEQLAAKKLKCRKEAIVQVRVIRRSIDARHKPDIYFVFTLLVQVHDEQHVLRHCRGNKDVIPVVENKVVRVQTGSLDLECRPIVVGTGPAGLLAALTLARYGYRPLILERGYDIEQRALHVEEFWNGGAFRPDSNVQFGEGGAGTFSDGKLTTRVNHPMMSQIIDVFVEAGAPDEIRYAYNPHIGTDILRRVVKRIRHMIEEAGGEVRFNSCVTDIVTDAAGCIRSVTVNGSESVPASVVILGIGHSARDTYYMLHDKGIRMEAKPFSVGVRIEHPQDLIDWAQYGHSASELGLDAADYALVYHRSDGRAAYSFCMCPGGQVVAAASEAGGVVTNGMSLHDRGSGIANSALVVNVTTADVGGGPLDGIVFQRKYERLAFMAGGSDYRAPAQSVGDFLGRPGAKRDGSVYSYRPGVTWTDLHEVLPEFASATLEQALPYFGRRIHGFDGDDIVMTGVETRTSAPVRILRGIDRVAVDTGGLYPVGEGAGYAGGIMSAALDGMESAIQIIEKYKPMEGK
jgi:uncharacterized FAD-dependent dehydrogenase